MACCSLETGSKIIGYFQAICSALSILILIFYAVHGIIAARCRGEKYNDNAAFIITIVVVVIIYSTVSLVFSSLLLNGVYKKKPSHILSYFIYSVVVIAIQILGTITLVFTVKIIGFLGISQVVVSSLLQRVVWLTYKKIKMEQQGGLHHATYVSEVQNVTTYPPAYSQSLPKDYNIN